MVPAGYSQETNVILGCWIGKIRQLYFYTINWWTQGASLQPVWRLSFSSLIILRRKLDKMRYGHDKSLRGRLRQVLALQCLELSHACCILCSGPVASSGLPLSGVLDRAPDVRAADGRLCIETASGGCCQLGPPASMRACSD